MEGFPYILKQFLLEIYNLLNIIELDVEESNRWQKKEDLESEPSHRRETPCLI